MGEFHVVKLQNSIKLVPIEDVPVEGLREATNGAEIVDLDGISEKVDRKAKEELKEEF